MLKWLNCTHPSDSHLTHSALFINITYWRQTPCDNQSYGTQWIHLFPPIICWSQPNCSSFTFYWCCTKCLSPYSHRGLWLKLLILLSQSQIFWPHLISIIYIGNNTITLNQHSLHPKVKRRCMWHTLPPT